MDLYVGLLLHKLRSDRYAQVAGLDADYVYLTWDDNGVQTKVRRSRLNRTNEWAVVVAYQEAS